MFAGIRSSNRNVSVQMRRHGDYYSFDVGTLQNFKGYAVH
jgi:hypothetical protein